MGIRLRRAIFFIMLGVVTVALIAGYDGLAKEQVAYAAPKRPAVTKKKATPAPQQEAQQGVSQSSGQSESPSQSQSAPSQAQPEAVSNVTQPEQAQQPQAEQLSAQSVPVIDVSRASEGSVSVTYDGGGTHILRLQANGSKADYKVKGNGKKHTVQLTLGSGEYTVSYMLKVSGSKYVVGAASTCYYEGAAAIIEPDTSGGVEQPQQISADDARFLGVTNEVNWNSSQAAIQKAGSLASDESTTKAKITKIYKFVIQNILYDYDVYGKLPSGYLPDIDRTYSSRKGICYDFSALFSGMLRSQGIPAKLCKGSSTLVSGYHAWNAVLLDGKWYVVDTSSDSIYVQNNVAPKMFKSSSDYSARKEG